MEIKDTTQDRVRTRDAGMRLLNRLTTGAAVSAVAGVALLGAVSAYTIPGTTSSSTASTSTTASSSSSSISTSSGLQSSTTPVSSSSSSGVAVSGGS
jgi:hypothetical protein